MHIDATVCPSGGLRMRVAGPKPSASASRKETFQEITPRKMHHCLTSPELWREYSSRVRERQSLDV